MNSLSVDGNSKHPNFSGVPEDPNPPGSTIGVYEGIPGESQILEEKTHRLETDFRLKNSHYLRPVLSHNVIEIILESIITCTSTVPHHDFVVVHQEIVVNRNYTRRVQSVPQINQGWFSYPEWFCRRLVRLQLQSYFLRPPRYSG